MVKRGHVELVTVLFSDLAGSTAQRVRVGEEVADRLRAEHDRAVVGAIARHSGRVVKHTGDGVMAIFNGASEAVASAVALQRAITRAGGRESETALRVRVGLSAGDVTVEGEDCFGLPVVEAQRLEGAAEPGQILCVGLVRMLAHGRGGHEFRSVGALDLKGLEGPLEVDEVLWRPLVGASSAHGLPSLVTAATGFRLVGRDEELGVIERQWDETTEGMARVVLLAGEPGAGKTRLAAEAARRVAERGGLVLAGRCDEHVAVPYQPFTEALAYQLRCDGGDIELGPLGNELQRLLPELGEVVPGLGPALVAEPDAERLQLFDAVCGWLRDAADEQSLLLLLDDLHWADLGTVLLLRHIAISAPVERLLVVATYRDTDVDRGHPLSSLLGDLRRGGSVTRIALKGLTPEDVETLVSSAAGHELDQAGTELARAVHAETSGNPFFVGEVLRHLIESGAIERRDGRWVADATGATAIVLPEGVRDVVGRRVSLLPDEAQRALSIAAVVGPEFSLDVVAAVAGLDDDQALDVIEPALNAQLVREVGIGAYRFAHALVSSTLRDELSETRRTRLHRRIAEALEELHGDEPAFLTDLARHWAAGAVGQDATALAYVERAAEQALAAAAPDDAARWYRVALDLIDDDPYREAELLLRAGKAEHLAGLRVAHDTLLDAAQRADELGDIDLMSSALLVLHRRTMMESDEPDPEKMALLERAIARVAPDDADRRPCLLVALAIECVSTGEVDRRASLIAEADALRGRMTNDADKFWVFRQSASALPRRLRTTNLARARLAGYREAAPWIAASTDAMLRFDYLEGMWSLQVVIGDRAAADAAFEKLRAFVQQTGHPLCDDQFAQIDTEWALIDGRLNDADRLSKEMRQRWAAHGVPDHEIASMYESFRFQLARERGLLTSARPRIVEAQLDRSRAPRPDVMAALAALTLVEAHQLDKAREIVHKRSQRDFTDIPDDGAMSIAFAAWAEASAATENQPAAAAMYRILTTDPDRHVETSGWYLGSSQRYLALLADTLGKPNEADERFAAAVTAHERMASPPWLARTYLDWANHKLAHHDKALARSLAERAITVIGELPLTSQEQRANRFLISLR